MSRALEILERGGTAVISPAAVSRELDGETVILDMERGHYFGLGDVGTRVWQLLESPTTVAAARDAIVTEFDVSAETCERDLLVLLGELADAGLVEVRE